MSVETRIAAADWYIERSFRTGTAWGTLVDGTCRCPKGAACDQKPGKHPTSPHGFHDATSDRTIIRRLLSAGSEPNLLVVVPAGCFGWDLDGDDAERIRGLESTLGLLPPTLGHQTPNGRHVVYRWPAGAQRPKKVLGVVTRWGDGEGMGYLIGAGSRLGEREYRVLRDEQGQPLEIVELPDAWMQAAIEAARPAPTLGPIGGYQLPERVESNHRYDAILSYVASRYHHGLTEAELWACVRDVLAPTFAERLPETGPDSLRSRFERAWKGTPEKLGPPAALLSAEGDVPSGRKQSLSFLTGAELAADTPVAWEYLVTPYIALGMIHELDGKPKTAGKTTLLLHLIAALLDGAPFLGQPTRQTPVVLLTEQTRRSLAPTLRGLGLDRDELLILTWPDAVGASWPEIVAAAVAACGRIGARLLAIDTLSPFVGLGAEMENDAAAALSAMRPLQAAAQADDLAILLTRHDRKGGGDVAESGRGSNAWSGAVDVVMALRRQPNPVRPTIRELEAISRRGDVPEEPVLIELTEAGYIVLGDAGAVAHFEARDRVRECLSAQHDAPLGGLTLDELTAAIERPRVTVQRAVKALHGAGELVKAGKGRAGDPFRYSLDPDPARSAQRSPLRGEPVVGQTPDEPVSAPVLAEARAVFGDMLKPPAEPTDLSAMVPRRRADA